MTPGRIHDLLDELGEVAARATTVPRLAAELGAAGLYAFVPDPDRPTTWIPAVGFPTAPSLRGWRALLARCAAPGIHHGEAAYPDPRATAIAQAHAFERLVVVLIAPSMPEREVHDLVSARRRTLAAMFGAEIALVGARGQLEVERQHAEQTSTLAHALDRARGDAERATRVKDEFLAMLGHELRNPLAPIVTAVQLLRSDGVAARALDILERQVAHMVRLVDDLLDVSRITSGKVELRKTPTELASVVTRAIEMSRPLLEQRRSELVVDVAERGLVVDGDPARLAQVVANLVTNAAKYSDPGARIELRAARDGERLQLRVIDAGIGIDPALLDRVFDQFVQVPQGLDRSQGGLGLGLAIVRSLVQHHDGTVRAHSDGAGCGSTFTVTLPRCAATPAASSAAPQIEPTRTGARVLVVDDNVDAAVMLGELLETHGYETRVAHTGPDALAEARTFHPDTALLDIGLPGMDGYELARRMRADYPAATLVALTGYGQANDRERVLATGFDAHLVKPVRTEDLIGVIERLRGR